MGRRNTIPNLYKALNVSSNRRTTSLKRHNRTKNNQKGKCSATEIKRFFT